MRGERVRCGQDNGRVPKNEHGVRSAERPRSWAYARDDNRLLSWDELVLLPVQ